MNATLKIVVRPDFTRKNGTKNLLLRITIKSIVKYYPLYIYVKPMYFKNGKVSRGDIEHFRKNILIDQALNKANKIIYDYRINEKQLSFESFRNDFHNKIYGSQSLYDFFDTQIPELKQELSPNTIKSYISQIRKLRQYKPSLLFSEINIKFIKDYELFLMSNRKNNKNTINKTLKIIKSILNRAKRQDIIKENVFDRIPIRTIEADRQYLTIQELQKLENLYSSGMLKPNIGNILRYFLFCCYTGLRYGDIKSLRFDDLKENNKYISIQMIKTKKPVIIPLIDKAKNLIPSKHFDKQKVFKVFTSQPTNRYLKEIMNIACISKQISFHCARHTFATLSKSLGMDYDVISKLLGHTDIKTTKIYTKYETGLLSREMEKWNSNKAIA